LVSGGRASLLKRREGIKRGEEKSRGRRGKKQLCARGGDRYELAAKGKEEEGRKEGRRKEWL